MAQPWIVADSEVLGGKPRIRGTRISVDFILELFASEASREQILEAYPHLSAEALSAALTYAATALGNEALWEVAVSR